MTQAAADDVRLLPEPLAGGPELAAGLVKVMAAKVAHLDLLEVPPDAFFRIHLRGITGEALEVDPLGRSVAQILPDRFAAVDRRAIPDDHQLARNDTPQMIQEADHLGTRDRRLVDLEVQPLVHADRPDHREMITAEGMAQDRGFAHASIGARHRGQEIEAAFIEEEQRALLVNGLLF